MEKKTHQLLESDAVLSAYMSPTQATGGRPKFVVTQTQIERLTTLGFSSVTMSKLLGISRTTLWRRRKELSITDGFDRLSNEGIDEIVEKYRNDHPFTGEKELIGHIRSMNLTIQRYRIRESIHRIDPINTALRWNDTIKRRASISKFIMAHRFQS
jgi:hypothetical protein